MTDVPPTLILSLRNNIRACTKCPLSASTTPVPWSGDTFPDIAIIGEAPGRTEARDGEPFIGSAGQKLRTLLRQSGINPDKVAYVNAVSCFPNGTPDNSHINACRSWMRTQVALLQPRYVITVGVIAFQSVRGDIQWPKLQAVHGKPMEWYNPPIPANPEAIISTYHPAAALRSTKYQRLILEDLQAFNEFRQAHESGIAWPSDCVVCGDGFYNFDDWALALCRRHAQRQGVLFPEDISA